jgi:metal-sulfur cluster biosynthetic enzyme
MSEDFLAAAARLDAPPAPVHPPDLGEIDEVDVWRALATVIDPEIGLDIVTVGLIYEVEIVDRAVRVIFTLTTPACPLEGVITSGIEQAVLGVDRVEEVRTELVWEPRWNPGMIRDDAW